MGWRLLRAILILPVNVTIVIPALFLWIAADTAYAHHLCGLGDIRFWSALLLFVIGIGLAVWTSVLFVALGKGTPAPWDPPRKLVIAGPYQYVRNPMILSVVTILAAESLYFQSWPLVLWMLTFFIGNTIYFPLVEEKGLEKRFGDAWLEYRRNVRRWIPRLSPWQPASKSVPPTR